jgi:hypothetical protein
MVVLRRLHITGHSKIQIAFGCLFFYQRGRGRRLPRKLVDFLDDFLKEIGLVLQILHSNAIDGFLWQFLLGRDIFKITHASKGGDLVTWAR